MSGTTTREDRRLWAGDVYVGAGGQLPGDAPRGSLAIVDGELFQRKPGTSVLVWESVDNPPIIASPSLAFQVSTGGNGWADNGTRLRIKASEYVAQVRFRRIGTTVTTSANGNITDTYVVGLPAPFRSDIGAAGAGYVNVPSVGSYGMIWRFDSTGQFWMTASTNPSVAWPAGTQFAADVHIPR
jgi:hypothetical protein